MARPKILLGVCGGIAAYKIAALTRLFAKADMEVRVIMTKEAQAFITPLTLATLSKNPVISSLYNPEDGSWNNHVDLGLWADLMIIAPATANTLSKMAHGASDNLLLTTYLSARCPVWVAPAMDLDMWRHPASQENIKKLQEHKVYIVAPGDGELASGLSGVGRMAEPEAIFEEVKNYLDTVDSIPSEVSADPGASGVLEGKLALITAGPTYESIDPVRFIGNHSSGKMGIAIAEALAGHGADVILVKGPSSLSSTHPRIKEIAVRSAAQMYEACIAHFEQADVFVGAAAVADYTPSTPADQKIKKKEGAPLTLELKRTKDILWELGQKKKNGQILVGFALETQNEVENALSKLARKNLDLIVLNSLNDEGAGFKGDTNVVTLIESQHKMNKLPLKSKTEVAQDITRCIIAKLAVVNA
ncbi:MAG: phosphopantothenoylcysteine decarboxylase/phosphopantothenate--cysteine ligase [Limisphaerales bacterium]|jgi:phosphopantothenoylcysteine decarboxylase/phosphopantothenate--cysteine ligase